MSAYTPPTYPDMARAGGSSRLVVYFLISTVLITPMYATFVFDSESWLWFIAAALLAADAASARMYWRYRAKAAEHHIALTS